MKYDVAVIGAGSAGLTAAKTARGFGKRVVLIDKAGRFGGECTWTGCVPSKALIKAAEIAYHIKQSKRWGIDAQVQPFGTQGVMAYVRDRIAAVAQTHTPEEIQKLGIDVVLQEAHFKDQQTLQLADGSTLQARKIIICTGSSPAVPPIEGIYDVPYLTNQTFFAQKELPESLIILGAGPIGIEMASACNRLGTKVQLIERADRILPREDHQMADQLLHALKHEGVACMLGMRAVAIHKSDSGIRVTCIDAYEQQHVFYAQALLLAVGQRPNSASLALDAAGIMRDEKGYIITDATLRTHAKHVYACGDVVGPYMFSHVAWYQAVLAVRNALVPFFKKNIDYRTIIWVTFAAPELASAGLNEAEAVERYGKDGIIINEIPYSKLDRAVIDNAEQGLVKCITDKRGRLLGMHILGARAGDIIHELQLAASARIPLQRIQGVMHAYPTYSELVWQAGKQAYVDRLLADPFVRLMRRLTRKY